MWVFGCPPSVEGEVEGYGKMFGVWKNVRFWMRVEIKRSAGRVDWTIDFAKWEMGGFGFAVSVEIY